MGGLGLIPPPGPGLARHSFSAPSYKVPCGLTCTPLWPLPLLSPILSPPPWLSVSFQPPRHVLPWSCSLCLGLFPSGLHSHPFLKEVFSDHPIEKYPGPSKPPSAAFSWSLSSLNKKDSFCCFLSPAAGRHPPEGKDFALFCNIHLHSLGQCLAPSRCSLNGHCVNKSNCVSPIAHEVENVPVLIFQRKNVQRGDCTCPNPHSLREEKPALGGGP